VIFFEIKGRKPLNEKKSPEIARKEPELLERNPKLRLLMHITRNLMELPALLPKDLGFVSQAANDQALFDLLLRKTDTLVRFFAAANEDETWSEAHTPFMKQTLGWLTNQFFQDKLDQTYAEAAAEAYYKHLMVLENVLPLNITVNVGQSSFPANALLLGVYSSYLKELLRRECRDRNQRVLTLSGISEEDASYLISYLHTGKFQDLWRKSQNEIISLLNVAMKMRLHALSRECQLTLKRYLTRENVIETLLQAHKMRWFYLKEAACTFYNNLELGAHLQAIDLDHLSFEFLDFLDRTWEVFLKLSPWITHLTVSGNLTTNSLFETAMSQCPNLISLDLSGSVELSPYLEKIPKKVQELSLARCSWLNDATLKTFVLCCSQIGKLSLEQDTQLSYIAFGELKKLP